EKLLSLYNREEKILSIPALGDPRVRGGSGIYLDLHENDINLKQWALVQKVSHTFEGPKHTMDMELKIQ
ncbi:MAG TPA: hydrolase, partial [Clostridium sp.]|nr:hydrolase [Clostridium sp.]